MGIKLLYVSNKNNKIIFNSTFDFGAFKFFDFGDVCCFLSPEMFKLQQERDDDFKKYKIHYRKDVMYFWALRPFCMHCKVS